eukprot:5288738-Amphidinium_carterae.1
MRAQLLAQDTQRRFHQVDTTYLRHHTSTSATRHCICDMLLYGLSKFLHNHFKHRDLEGLDRPCLHRSLVACTCWREEDWIQQKVINKGTPRLKSRSWSITTCTASQQTVDSVTSVHPSDVITGPLATIEPWCSRHQCCFKANTALTTTGAPIP